MIHSLALVLSAVFLLPGSAVSGVDEADTQANTTARLFVLEGGWTDQPDPGETLDINTLLMGGSGTQRSFPDLMSALAAATADDEIDVLALDLGAGTQFTIPQITRLCASIEGARAAGKKCIAWLENSSTGLLAVASSCNSVIMTRTGGLDFHSPAMMPIHFKTAMDLFGVEASVIRVGDFKGAVEPFMLPQMSDHLRDHYMAMLESLNQFVVQQVASGRGLDANKVREMQKLRIFTPAQALDAHLVDALADHGTIEETIESILDRSVEWKRARKKRDTPFNPIKLFTELFSPKRQKSIPADSIVVLHLAGQIIDGDTATPGSMVSEPSAKEIDALADNDSVAAVVVRVDSGGGSATASEVIRVALENLASKKPVVYSMGNLAASGGYWITCTGRPIYASEGTITGSIGVFGMKLSFGPALERLGVHIDPVALDDAAMMMLPDRPWNADQIGRLQATVDDVYNDFIAHVCKSRDMDPVRVRAIAGGRVWSGQQALDLGLVDAIGSLDDAVAHARREAGLEADSNLVHRPGPTNPMDIFKLLGGGGDEAIRSLVDFPTLRLLALAGVDLRPYVARLLSSSPDGGFTVEARMPVDLNPRF
ncbi:MAG: signal peptide peptidase SppA [Planctomycetota bacterium]|nr:signal peptide peptidase SppA [Planctomycetota bacterium]